MQFRVLGPLEVVGADGLLSIRRGKRRALLALLLIHAAEEGLAGQADREHSFVE
jgi:DNA-binding SARP family transcriptional activator